MPYRPLIECGHTVVFNSISFNTRSMQLINKIYQPTPDWTGQVVSLNMGKQHRGMSVRIANDDE